MRCTAVIISFFWVTLYGNTVLYAQEKTVPWTTAVVSESEPKDFNPALIGKIRDKLQASLSQLPNAAISEAPADAPADASAAERIITIHIREIRKESAAAGESGADRYIMKRIPPITGITVRVKNAETAASAEISESVTGYEYAPEGNPYVERFASFFPPRHAAVKDVPPSSGRIYLSAYLSGELPFAGYSDYAGGGGLAVLEGAVSSYRYHDLVLGVQTAFGAMSPKKGKLDPYYKFPVYFVGGYRFAVMPKTAVLPSLGAGVMIHRIHSRTYTNPAMTLQLRGLYEFAPGFSVFVLGGYSAFRDSAFTGQSVSISIGCQYGLGFN